MVHLLAVMSPGPDLILAFRNSIVYSRKTGILTALGFSLGISVHVVYCLAGLALVITQSIIVFNVIKLLGAGYLIWIGWKSLRSKGKTVELGATEGRADIAPLQAIKEGFFTNVLNPKATLFFLSLFSMMIPPQTPFYVLLIISLIMIVNTFLWFSLVSVLLTKEKIKNTFNQFQAISNKFFGVMLISLGMKIAFTQKQ